MNVFERDGKVNFVDTNNVMLGYDTNQSCCETADWFVSDTPQDNYEDANSVQFPHNDNLGLFVFDAKFFKRITGSQFDEGGMVIFRITSGDSEKFLHIFNHHNGYYGHGFEFAVAGEVLHSDTL